MSDFDSRYDGNGEGYAVGNNKGSDPAAGGGGGGSPYDAFEERDSRQKNNPRESDREKPRTRERDRDKDRDRHYRDDRGRDFKDRNLRDDRGRGNMEYDDRRRGRDYDRHRDFDRDRERRHRNRSRSRSRDKPRNRSRSHSPSRSRSKSKRTSGFDMAPPATAMLSGAAVPGQLPGAPFILNCLCPSRDYTRPRPSLIWSSIDSSSSSSLQFHHQLNFSINYPKFNR